MRHAHATLLLATAACAIAIATPAATQAASTASSAYSNSAAAGQVQSQEDALTKKIEQDDSRLDSEIGDICPSCGGAEYLPDAPVHQQPPSIYNGFNHQPTAPVHQRLSPIYNGFNHQPTEDELRALHQQDVTRDQAQETDRLYDQLMSSSNQILRQNPAPLH